MLTDILKRRQHYIVDEIPNCVRKMRSRYGRKRNRVVNETPGVQELKYERKEHPRKEVASGAQTSRGQIAYILDIGEDTCPESF